MYVHFREDRWIKFCDANNIKSPVKTIKSNSSSSATVSNKLTNSIFTVS